MNRYRWSVLHVAGAEVSCSYYLLVHGLHCADDLHSNSSLCPPSLTVSKTQVFCYQVGSSLSKQHEVVWRVRPSSAIFQLCVTLGMSLPSLCGLSFLIYKTGRISSYLPSRDVVKINELMHSWCLAHGMGWVPFSSLLLLHSTPDHKGMPGLWLLWLEWLLPVSREVARGYQLLRILGGIRSLQSTYSGLLPPRPQGRTKALASPLTTMAGDNKRLILFSW